MRNGVAVTSHENNLDTSRDDKAKRPPDEIGPCLRLLEIPHRHKDHGSARLDAEAIPESFIPFPIEGEPVRGDPVRNKMNLPAPPDLAFQDHAGSVLRRRHNV